MKKVRIQESKQRRPKVKSKPKKGSSTTESAQQVEPAARVVQQVLPAAGENGAAGGDEEEDENTYGMLLRSGKRGVIFKPYSDSLLRRRQRQTGIGQQAGYKRKYDECTSRDLDEADLVYDDLDDPNYDFEKSCPIQLSEFEYFEDLEQLEAERRVVEKHTTTINNLFPEILTMIFDKLDVQSLGRVAQVCRTWRDASYRKSCWKGVEAKLHIGKSNPPLYQSLHKRGISKVQVLSLKRTIRELMTIVPLQKLNLSGCYNFTDTVVDGCFFKRDFANLKVLDLSLCKEIHDGAVALMSRKCPNIQELDLAGCSSVTNQGLKDVATNLRHLRKLNLRSCRQITDAGIGYLAKAKSHKDHCGIEDLTLQDCQKLTDESLSLLSKDNKVLSSLNLSFCVSITDTGLKSLSRIRTLKSLNVRSCDNVSDIGISFLAEPTSRQQTSPVDRPCSGGLEDLDVSFCANVTNSSLHHIASGFPNLKSLSMTTCSITDHGLKRLAKQLQTSLESLNIGQCTAITDDGIKHLSDHLKKIRFLDIYGCPKISPKVISQLRVSIPTLEEVNRQL